MIEYNLKFSVASPDLVGELLSAFFSDSRFTFISVSAANPTPVESAHTPRRKSNGTVRPGYRPKQPGRFGSVGHFILQYLSDANTPRTMEAMAEWVERQGKHKAISTSPQLSYLVAAGYVDVVSNNKPMTYKIAERGQQHLDSLEERPEE